MSAKVFVISSELTDSAAIALEIDRQLKALSSQPVSIDGTMDRFCTLKEQIKVLETELEGLKDTIKGAIGTTGALNTPHFAALLKECARTDLDKAGLTRDFGADVIAKYTKASKYTQLIVQRIGGA